MDQLGRLPSRVFLIDKYAFQKNPHRVSYARPGVLPVAKVPRGKRVDLRRPGVDAFNRQKDSSQVARRQLTVLRLMSVMVWRW